MNKQVLFIPGTGDEGYELDAKLVASLQAALGKGYELKYPHLQTDEAIPDFGWPAQIGNEISAIKGGVFLVGHSLGASMLLKFLSENKVEKKPAGIFLLATPFWSGEEDWKKGLRLQEKFADQLPKGLPVFLYHCRDDEEVPFSQFSLYKHKLTGANFREIASGGHQFNNDLSLVAKDIKSL